MTKTQPSPNPTKAPKPRWFGHPALLTLIGVVLLIDILTMHRESYIKRIQRSPTTRYIHTPATIHDDGSGLTIAWRYEPGYRSGEHFVKNVGVAKWLLHQTNGRFHATSVSGGILPWPLLNGYAEKELADAIHESAVRSNSDGATYLRQHYPDAMDLLARGKLHYSKTLPMGYVRNAIFFGLILALMVCTIWGRADLWAKRITKAIGPPTRNPNACPHCGYDATGLAICPECGSRLDQ